MRQIVRHHSRFIAPVLAVLAAASCSSNPSGLTITQNGGTLVQLVNTQDAVLTIEDIVNPSIYQVGVAGQSSQCFEVNPVTPGLVVIPSTTTTPNAVAVPLLAANSSYLVTVMPGIQGAMSFNLFQQTFTPAAGDAALRVINAAASTNTNNSFDVYVTAPGGPLSSPAATSILFPHGSFYFNVAAGTSDIRITYGGSQNVLIDMGNIAFTAGTYTTIIITDPLAGAPDFRAFVAGPGC